MADLRRSLTERIRRVKDGPAYLRTTTAAGGRTGGTGPPVDRAAPGSLASQQEAGRPVLQRSAQDPPATPGRKAGENYGPKAHREIPRRKPDEIIDVPLPDQCPDCGGQITEEGQARQFQMEIPRRPILRRFDIHIGHCRGCGKRIQPRHPLQTSDALGAAASQLGPDAQAAIVHLNKQAGLSHGKIAAFFWDLFGIRVTPSGVCQAMQRAARRCEPIYQQILASVPQSPWIVPDETGWPGCTDSSRP